MHRAETTRSPPPPVRRILDFSDDEVGMSDGESISEGSVGSAHDDDEALASPSKAVAKVLVPVVTPAPPPRASFSFSCAPAWLPQRLSLGISRAMFGKRSSKGCVSTTDRRVYTLPRLDVCPKENRVSCRCEELSHGSSPGFVRDLRAMYCSIIMHGNRRLGNEFLLSLMVPKLNSGNKHGFAFKLPGFIDEGLEDKGAVVRVFYVCQPQFLALFGMGTKRLYKLIKLRRQQVCGWPCDEHHLRFGWSGDERSYILFGTPYKAFRSSHWVDQKVASGEYSTWEMKY